MTTHLPIAAGIGIEGIIWLIILIFWGIAQTIQQSRRKRPGAPPPPGGRPASPIDEDIREMLEQLSGRTTSRPAEREFEVELDEDDLPARPPPVRAQPPPPPPPPPRPTAPRPVQRPPVRVSERKAAPRPAYRPEPIRPIEPVFTHGAIADVKAMISAEDFAAASAASSGLNSPGLSMRMKGMSFQGMATMPSGLTGRARGVPEFAPEELLDRKALRKAILTKIILDPPPALVPYGRDPAR
ncbi:MAG TPA: hypothetical protein PKE12_13675 [Kiritimatiellia bacterium]|nr:hypothetical protein [Kiritimatiellia bacterium]